MEEQETGLSEEGVSKIYCYKIECRIPTSQTSKIQAWGFNHEDLWLWLPRL